MRTAEKDLLVLLNRYPQLRPVPHWERGRIVPCPECHGSGIDPYPPDKDDPDFNPDEYDGVCGGCSGQDYLERGAWSCADQVWFGAVDGHTVAISVFSLLPEESWLKFWFSVEVFPDAIPLPEGEVSIEFQNYRNSNQASTSSWNGEFSGSGIRRVPDSLRGFLYRTTYEDQDTFILPEDIIKFLIDNPRS